MARAHELSSEESNADELENRTLIDQMLSPAVNLKSTRVMSFTPCLVKVQNLKSCYSTCDIECLRPMYGALNVDEKKN